MMGKRRQREDVKLLWLTGVLLFGLPLATLLLVVGAYIDQGLWVIWKGALALLSVMAWMDVFLGFRRVERMHGRVEEAEKIMGRFDG